MDNPGKDEMYSQDSEASKGLRRSEICPKRLKNGPGSPVIRTVWRGGRYS